MATRPGTESAVHAIEAAAVSKFFGDYAALRNVSFTAPPGAVIALLGRNGAGKTTLLKILAGLSRPTQGQVRIFGKDSRDPETRQKVGVLGHGIGVYDELSAFENLRLFAELYGLPHPKQIAMEWLERTDLARVKDGLAREFSRGMRQRLAVARAFLHRPHLLLFDEPFTALDDRAIGLLQGLLKQARDEGKTIVMSTHQIREAMELATNVVLIARGKLIHAGPRTQEMLADPGYLYRTYGDAA
jgi:heme ABC exporter ATP-binding subunit CcmA